MMLEFLGGYDAWLYWVFVLGILILGSTLNAIDNMPLRLLGIGFFIWGGIELVGYIVYTLDNTPNHHDLAEIFPILFAAILILTCVKMLSMKPMFFRKVKDDDRE